MFALSEKVPKEVKATAFGIYMSVPCMLISVAICNLIHWNKITLPDLIYVDGVKILMVGILLSIVGVFLFSLKKNVKEKILFLIGTAGLTYTFFLVLYATLIFESLVNPFTITAFMGYIGIYLWMDVHFFGSTAWIEIGKKLLNPLQRVGVS